MLSRHHLDLPTLADRVPSPNSVLMTHIVGLLNQIHPRVLQEAPVHGEPVVRLARAFKVGATRPVVSTTIDRRMFGTVVLGMEESLIMRLADLRQRTHFSDS